jgi:hypothetical protein
MPLTEYGSGYIDYEATATCTDCNIVKNNTHFSFYMHRFNKKTMLCLYSNKKCDDCRKIYMVNKKVSENELKNLKIVRPIPSLENPHKCDCCSKEIITTRTLQLDHCHLTGKFRGWICKECNISLGNLGDSVESVFRSIVYMNKTENKSEDELLNMVKLSFTVPTSTT